MNIDGDTVELPIGQDDSDLLSESTPDMEETPSESPDTEVTLPTDEPLDSSDESDPVDPPPDPGTAPETDPVAEAQKRLVAATRGVLKREKALREGFQQLHAQRDHLAKYGEQAQRIITLSRSDPIRFLSEYAGMEPETIARRVLNKGEASPEERIARAEREVAELREGTTREAQQRERAAAQHAARESFISGIRHDKRFAEVSACFPDSRALIREAIIVGELIASETGREASDIEIARRLKKRLQIFSGRSPIKTLVQGAKGKASSAKTQDNGRSQDSRANGSVVPGLNGGNTSGRETMVNDDLSLLDRDERRKRVIANASRKLANSRA